MVLTNPSASDVDNPAPSSIWRGPSDSRTHVALVPVHDRDRCAERSAKPPASRRLQRQHQAAEDTSLDGNDHNLLAWPRLAQHQRHRYQAAVRAATFLDYRSLQNGLNLGADFRAAKSAHLTIAVECCLQRAGWMKTNSEPVSTVHPHTMP